MRYVWSINKRIALKLKEFNFRPYDVCRAALIYSRFKHNAVKF